MNKKIIILGLIMILISGCSSAETVSYNLSKEANEYIEYIGMEDTFDKVLLEILKGVSNE